MPESSLSSVLMRITDGHPASAAEAARHPIAADRFSSAERVVLGALLRHAREKSLKACVLGDPAAANGSDYPLPACETAEN